MFQFALLFPVVASGLALGDSECGCNGKCSDPILDWKTDCPAYGYDCQRAHAALGLFRKHVHEDYISIRCADHKASLFVNGKSQKKLKCRKKSGVWKVNNKCNSVESALCALPCTTCSTRVPNFLTVDATSISVLAANGERPCSIGFCSGDGHMLIGIDASNVSTLVYGNVTCTGTGWMDNAGRIYSHAVCQYYSCSTLSIAAPSADTVPLVSSGSRSFACPLGSFLTYMNNFAIPIRIWTQYPLTCGPNNTWQLYGLDWDANNFANIACTPYLPCAMSINPVNECGDYGVCIPPTLTTVAYGTANVSLLTCPDPDYGLVNTNMEIGQRYICTGQKIVDLLDGNEVTSISCLKVEACPETVMHIGSTICVADAEHCTPATVTSSSISCPPGSTLAYMYGDGAYSTSVGNLTCYAGSTYYDSGSFIPKLTSVTGATCTTKANLTCRPVPSVFAPDGISFELPPDQGFFYYGGAAAIDPELDIVDGQIRMFINKTQFDGGLIYYNNNFSTGTQKLQCGDDGMWHTPANIIVTSATYATTLCGSIPPPYPAGSNPLSFYTSTAGCTHFVYQLPGDSVQITIDAGDFYVLCATNGQYALPIDGDYFIPPPGTLIGCVST